MTTVATAQKVENLFLATGLPGSKLRQASGRIANDYATDPLAWLKGTWLLNHADQTLNYHGYDYNLRNDGGRLPALGDCMFDLNGLGWAHAETQRARRWAGAGPVPDFG